MTGQNITSWLVGLGGVSLLLGSIVTWVTWKKLHSIFKSTAKEKNWEVKWEEAEKVPFIPRTIGVFERIFFTTMVAFNISGVGVAMATWMLIKMATGWNRITSSSETWRRMLSFTGLLCSITSLFFALLGGLIAGGRIPLPDISRLTFEIKTTTQFISILFTLLGAFMTAFGYRVKQGISRSLGNELNIDKMDLIAPSDIKQRPEIFYGGLLLLVLATVCQIIIISGTLHG